MCAVCAVCVAAGRLKCRVEPRNSSCPTPRVLLSELTTRTATATATARFQRDRLGSCVDVGCRTGCWVGVGWWRAGTRYHGSLAQPVKRTHLRRVSVVTTPSSRSHTHNARPSFSRPPTRARAPHTEHPPVRHLAFRVAADCGCLHLSTSSLRHIGRKIINLALNRTLEPPKYPSPATDGMEWNGYRRVLSSNKVWWCLII